MVLLCVCVFFPCFLILFPFISTIPFPQQVAHNDQESRGKEKFCTIRIKPRQTWRLFMDIYSTIQMNKSIRWNGECGDAGVTVNHRKLHGLATKVNNGGGSSEWKWRKENRKVRRMRPEKETQNERVLQIIETKTDDNFSRFEWMASRVKESRRDAHWKAKINRVKTGTVRRCLPLCRL